MKNFGLRLNRTLDFLKGDVRYADTKSFDIKDCSKNLIDHTGRFYNSIGHREEVIFYEKDNIIRMRQVSEFDEVGNKIGYINYDKHGSRQSSGKYVLDNNGRVVSKFHNGVHEESYKYDYADNIIEVFYPVSCARDIYEYNESSLAIQQLSIREGNSPFSNLLGGPKKKLSKFVNDDSGNITEMKIYNAETNELLFSQENFINMHGDEIESISCDGNGSIHSHVKYGYKYDNICNWNFMMTMNKDGVIYRKQKRKILYGFEDDVPF